MKALRVTAGLLLALGATLRCGDGGTDPDTGDRAGTAVVSLATPHTDDGAVVVTLRGVGMSNVQATSTDYVVFARSSGANELRVIVVGDLAAGPLFRLNVAAVNRLDAYTTAVDQVATRGDALRTSLAGMELTVAAAQ
jgi:hypothetical protein